MYPLYLVKCLFLMIEVAHVADLAVVAAVEQVSSIDQSAAVAVPSSASFPREHHYHHLKKLMDLHLLD